MGHGFGKIPSGNGRVFLMIPRFMAQCRDVFHHTRIPHPGRHPEIIEPRHPEIMLQLCHFQGIGGQLVDVAAQDHGFGGRMPEELLEGLEGIAVAHEGYERLSRSSKYLDLDIPAVVRFVRIWVVGTSLGLVLITKGRLIPGLVIII